MKTSLFDVEALYKYTCLVAAIAHGGGEATKMDIRAWTSRCGVLEDGRREK